MINFFLGLSIGGILGLVVTSLLTANRFGGEYNERITNETNETR